MANDKYDEMDTEQLQGLLKKRYGFEDDEIKNLFDTDDKMREALREFKQASTRTAKDDEAALGWDQEDSQPLTVDQEKAVDNKKKMGRKIAEAKKKREEGLRKLQEEETKSDGDKELKESIQEAGNQVTPSEVKSSMKDVRRLLEEE